MKLSAKLMGDPVGDAKKFKARLAKATKGGIVEAATALKNNLREETRRAGLGQRLANTWQGPPSHYVYPKSGESLDAAASVISKAPHIIDGYEKGAIIKSSSGRFLAVPLPQAQKLIGAGKSKYRITPRLLEEWMGIELVMIKRPGKHPLLVARGVRLSGGNNLNRSKGGGTIQKLKTRSATKTMGERTMLAGRADVPMFVLIPQVSIKKRLDISKEAKLWGSMVPSYIERRM